MYFNTGSIWEQSDITQAKIWCIFTLAQSENKMSWFDFKQRSDSNILFTNLLNQPGLKITSSKPRSDIYILTQPGNKTTSTSFKQWSDVYYTYRFFACRSGHIWSGLKVTSSKARSDIIYIYWLNLGTKRRRRHSSNDLTCTVRTC